MISASAADAHRFGRVKRNGYDPAEVDAVVARLVDALGSYERSNADLEERLAEADVSADAIRRTFIAAEQTRDEILEAAREQARRVVAEAEIEATGVVEDAQARAAEATARAEREVAALAGLADRLDLEISHRRESLLRDAEDRAAELLADAEHEAARRTMTSVEQTRAEAAAAVADIEQERRRADLAIRTMSMATAWIRREAELTARSIIDDARSEAGRIVADAARERGALSERNAELRAALEVLESGAARVAALTAHHNGVLDLATIERVETLSLDFAAVDPTRARASDLVDVEHIASDETAERTPEGTSSHPVESTVTPVVDGGPMAGPTRLVVAEAAPDLAVTETNHHTDTAATDEDGGLDTDDAPPTYYQRSTGIPLSERVKLARRSG